MNRFIVFFSVITFAFVLSGCSSDSGDGIVEEPGMKWYEVNSDCQEVIVDYEVGEFVLARMKYLVPHQESASYQQIRFRKTDLPIHEYKAGMILNIKVRGYYVNYNFHNDLIDTMPLHVVRPC